jgi:DNA-binding NtrC family response regulator
MKGVEFLSKVRHEFPDTIRYVLTGRPSLDVAIQSINEGAIDRFFTKPCNVIDLAITIRQALQQKELIARTKSLLNTVKRQAAVIEQTERESPGISKVKRDGEGTILLDESPTDLAEFIKTLDMEIAEAEKHLDGGNGPA